MPQLAVVMIFLAAMIGLVLLSWAAYDNRAKREQHDEPETTLAKIVLSPEPACMPPQRDEQITAA